ncbi:MAG: hypothetical protein R3230_01465 [Nitrosopumilaceae archaeon]|nr:hypothetical protein [Nitrosopumilaceae archaeon]
MAFNPGSEPGLFLPTTELFDVGDLEQAGVTNERFRELLIRLSQAFNDANLATNLKDTGYYVTQEFVCGQVYFPNPALSSTTAQTPAFRQVFRKVINFGALPNVGAPKTVAHNITFDANVSFTRIYGTATDPVNFIALPLPYLNVGGTGFGGNIELFVNSTHVSIEASVNATAFTTCYVVLEYLKN